MSRAHELALARMLAAYETPRAATATHDARKVTQHVHAMRAMLDSLGASCDDAARALYAERIARVEEVAMASADAAAATTLMEAHCFARDERSRRIRQVVARIELA